MAGALITKVLLTVKSVFTFKAHLSPDDAVAIARSECERRGWAFSNHVDVIHAWMPKCYVVHTNPDTAGGDHARIYIDVRNGTVKHAGYIPR